MRLRPPFTEKTGESSPTNLETIDMVLRFMCRSEIDIIESSRPRNHGYTVKFLIEASLIVFSDGSHAYYESVTTSYSPFLNL